MLLYGIDENDERVLAKFVLYGREISANSQIRTRDRPRPTGAHPGQGFGIAQGAAEGRSNAMQEAAVGQQAFDPFRSVVLAQGAVELANSQSGQKALSWKKTRGLSISLRGPVRHFGKCPAAEIDLFGFRF